MSATGGTPKSLPERPSLGHLRGQAKRLAKAQGLKLAAAQRQLAHDYGHASWTALVRHVEALAPARPLPPLHQAAKDGDLAEARRLLEAGESPRENAEGGLTPLHIAAGRGPWAMVDLLIRHGGLSWQPDDQGRAALEHARAGSARDKAEIVHKLGRPVMEDPDFRAAAHAIQQGDVAGLARLLDARPDLLRIRAQEPDCYPPTDYFGSPKLFWFVADNPTLVPKLAPNMLDIIAEMTRRGVDQDDLDYALELTMTSDPVTEAGLMAPMIAALAEAGARGRPRAVTITLAHRMREPVQVLLDRGMALTASAAAGLGMTRELPALLAAAAPEEVQNSFGMAVLNGEVEAAHMCLDAGADVQARMPVHVHATGLHSAAANEDVEMLKLLVSRGARTDVLDTLWRSTPLGWAQHNGWAQARAYLESLESP